MSGVHRRQEENMDAFKQFNLYLEVEETGQVLWVMTDKSTPEDIEKNKKKVKVRLKSKDPYPKVIDKIKYLTEWKKVEVTSRGGTAKGKNKYYFNVKAREGWTNGVHFDKVIWEKE